MNDSRPPGGGSISQEASEDERRLRGWRRWWTGLYAAVVIIVVASAVVGAVAGHHRHPGRPLNWTVLIVVVAVVVVVLGGVGAVSWRLQTRPGPNRQLLAAGNRRTNRRVGVALRKGRTIAPEDRRSAQALIDLYARRRWVLWFYVGLGVLWLASSFGAHGFRLVLHVALGVFYFSFTPYWVSLRRRTLRHGADQGLNPQQPTAAEPTVQ